MFLRFNYLSSMMFRSWCISSALSSLNLYRNQNTGKCTAKIFLINYCGTIRSDNLNNIYNHSNNIFCRLSELTQYPSIIWVTLLISANIKFDNQFTMIQIWWCFYITCVGARYQLLLFIVSLNVQVTTTHVMWKSNFILCWSRPAFTSSQQ